MGISTLGGECRSQKETYDYNPVCRVLLMIKGSTERRPNRLIHEKSPYLLQHAYNPVDWYPWGEEAFERAKKEDNPIFLSIGYSTCHWCHVMEQESFQDQEVASLMNETFICIKVDREERPDIDGVYMRVCQEMTGSGGWPLTIIMTPDKKPFFATTYIPKETRFDRIGMMELIPRIGELWRSRREELISSAEMITVDLLKQTSTSSRGGKVDKEVLDVAYQALSRSFDTRHGGFGHAPKFPSPHNLSFLLRYWKRTGEETGLRMVEKTLSEIAKGGIHDRIGGGFHRYSTDARWHIPHFEKMLYDQALISNAYLQLYQATGKQAYAQVARDIFTYVLRDMRDAKGGFYSAEDADSPIDAQHPDEKREGAFYLWDKQEVMNILGEEKGEIFCYHFGVKPGGNALPDPRGEFRGKNILHIAHSLDNTAEHFKKDTSYIQAVISESKDRLFQARPLRPRPHLDDKILVDWNGLVISSLAFGARVLDQPLYRDAAEKTARFILGNMMDTEGRLLHRYRDGEAAVPGMIDDYAFLIYGLIDLYQATFNIEYLRQADHFGQQMLGLFWDEKGGGFLFISRDRETLLIRRKEIYDGAMPSGNSVAALDLVRLAKVTMNPAYEKRAEELFRAFANEVSSLPNAHSQMLVAIDFALGPSQEIILAPGRDGRNLQPMIETIYRGFIPNKVVLLRPKEERRLKEAIQLIPLLQGYSPLDGKTTAYVCEGYVCRKPVTDPGELEEMLNRR